MAPPQPQSPSPTSTTQQFLSTVLSQRGPSSLPYTEDVKWLIRQHLLSLTDTCPSLSSKTAPFTHNDGRTVNLLQSYGTVPMVYQQVTYNIPVVIWLLESYPRHAPLVFVNPTRDMIVKHNHPFVNPSGIVSIPYLSNWVYPSSSLVELVRNLSHWFSNDPPLYSRTSPNPGPDKSPSPSLHPRPSASFWSSSGPGSNHRPSASLSSSGPARPMVPSTHPRPSTSFFSSGSAWPTIPPRVYPLSPYGSSGIGRRMDDPAEVFKKNAMENLEGKVCSDIEGLRKVKEVDMEGLLNVQGVLKQRKEELNRGVKEMLDEKEGLEQQLQMVLMNTDVLEGWVRDNEVKLKKIGDVNVDVDEAFEHCDSLSKQMSDCTASDLAMEDAIYSLDKAIQDGVIPFDQYLRNVRMLSREQFFQRATASKVRAAQIQDQVSNMASRLSQYALS